MLTCFGAKLVKLDALYKKRYMKQLNVCTDWHNWKLKTKIQLIQLNYESGVCFRLKKKKQNYSDFI